MYGSTVELKDGYIPFNFDWKNSHEEFTCNQWVNKTVYLFVPHHTDNMFHLHNDVITKLWTSVWGTGRADAPKTLWLLEGWTDGVKRSVEFFPVLNIIFDEVYVIKMLLKILCSFYF